MEMAERVRLRGIARGLVQGVNFRWFTQRCAAELNLSGYVRNRGDGSVEFVAEGPRPAVEQLLQAVRQGPSAAVVEQVETHWSQATGEFYRFEVRY
jgi:acylphosphatase